MPQTTIGSGSGELDEYLENFLRRRSERPRELLEIETAVRPATNEAPPLYHEKLLVVKLRAGMPAAHVKAVMAVTLERELTPEVTVSPALRLISNLERGGYIRRAISLSPDPSPHLESELSVRRPATTRLLRGLSEFRSQKKSARVTAGVTVLELENDVGTESLRRTLAEDPTVEFVARLPVRYHCAKKRSPRVRILPAAKPPVGELWNLRKIELAAARSNRKFVDANKIKVAVLDTGVDADHPDLKGQVKSYQYAYPDSGVSSGPRDKVGHGTHVSGVIAAASNNRIGIDGICNCNLTVRKIFGDETIYIPELRYFAYVVDPIMYAQALAACLDDETDVINLSIGGAGTPDQNERNLFQQLLDQGTTVVAAMGNEREYGSPTSYPAAIPGVIAVGATKIDDKVAIFSNRGAHIALCAPGVGIWSALPTYDGEEGFRPAADFRRTPIPGQPIKREREYAAWDGTSMATPHVTAAAALLLAKKGKMSPADVKAALQASSDPVGRRLKNGVDPDYGAGRLNLMNLLK